MDFVLPLMLYMNSMQSRSINTNFYKKFRKKIFFTISTNRHIYFFITLGCVLFWNIALPIIIHGK